MGISVLMKWNSPSRVAGNPLLVKVGYVSLFSSSWAVGSSPWLSDPRLIREALERQYAHLTRRSIPEKSKNLPLQ